MTGMWVYRHYSYLRVADRFCADGEKVVVKILAVRERQEFLRKTAPNICMAPKNDGISGDPFHCAKCGEKLV